MRPEALLLRGAGAEVIVIVEPRLPDRHHLGMARARNEIVDADIELLVGVVRMSADRAVDVRKALGDGEHLVVALDAGRDGDEPRDAGGLRARDHGVELVSEIGKVEMAVAVYQCQSRRGRSIFRVLMRHRDWIWTVTHSLGTYGASFQGAGHPPRAIRSARSLRCRRSGERPGSAPATRRLRRCGGRRQARRNPAPAPARRAGRAACRRSWA